MRATFVRIGFQTSIAGAWVGVSLMGTKPTPATFDRAIERGITDSPRTLATIATIVSHCRAVDGLRVNADPVENGDHVVVVGWCDVPGKHHELFVRQLPQVKLIAAHVDVGYRVVEE